MQEKRKVVLIGIGIIILASFFRFYGINWDQGQHLHPDERFLTMVTDTIDWPDNIYDYIDTATSPLNPHNRGFNFFVYGTFPIFFTKWVIGLFIKENYSNITIIGRYLSGLADLGTVILVYLIAKIITGSGIRSQGSGRKKNIHNSLFRIHHSYFPLLTMLLYSIMVLPIQLSRFYAVDTYLTFFITLSFYILTKIISQPDLQLSSPTKLRYSVSLWGFKRLLILSSILGLSLGLALASKISAVLFIPIIGLGLLFFLIKTRNFRLFIVICCLLSVVCYLTFRLAQPYLFANPNLFDLTLNQKVLGNWQQLKTFDDPAGWFPPAVQWIKTKPYLFPLKNLVLWGLGLPLGIVSITAVIHSIVTLFHCFIVQLRKKRLSINNYQLTISLSLFWVLLLFFYQGAQFVKALRYFYPIYPFLAILSAYFIYRCIDSLIQKCNLSRTIVSLLHCFIVILFLIYPLSFITIYSRPHTRVTASEWIYQNIPAGSVRSSEHWDDGIPLSLPKNGYIHEKYPVVEFPLYGADTREKWQEMDGKLKKVDYIILTSNRLYGAIMTFPERYPVTYRYYQALFDGSLGFQKIAEFTSRPNLPLPLIKICLTPPFARYGFVALKSQECNQSGISFVDDYADETFTVYDHPKVLIFKKVKKVDYFNLLFKSTVTSSIYSQVSRYSVSEWVTRARASQT